MSSPVSVHVVERDGAHHYRFRWNTSDLSGSGLAVGYTDEDGIDHYNVGLDSDSSLIELTKVTEQWMRLHGVERPCFADYTVIRYTCEEWFGSVQLLPPAVTGEPTSEWAKCATKIADQWTSADTDISLLDSYRDNPRLYGRFFQEVLARQLIDESIENLRKLGEILDDDDDSSDIGRRS